MDFTALLLRWRAISPAARAAAIALVAAIGLGVPAVAILGRPQQAPLFAAPLDASQTAEVTEQLAEWNVAFSPGSGNVFVPAGARNALLLRLSLAGVPHAHVVGSDDALAAVGALTPQAVIDAQAREGLAGDLELALRGIAGISDARVIIAPARAATFADDSPAPASASVRVRLLPGATLSASQVDGIRAFVSAAVPGLDPARVAMLDDRGVQLDRLPADDGSAAQRSLQNALDAAFGAGSTLVRVHASVDQRTIDMHTVSTAFRENAKRDGHRDGTLDRGTQTRDVREERASGRIARLTAAVLVDERHAEAIPAIRALASASLGLDLRRGDTLTVAVMPFAHAVAPSRDPWRLGYALLAALLPPFAAAAALLIAVRLGLVPALALAKAAFERRDRLAAASAVHGAGPERVHRLLEAEPPHAAAAIISALPASTAAAVLERYPPQERAAIVARMQRAHTPIVRSMEGYDVRG